MTVRLRLTLWYTTLLTVFVAAFAILVYVAVDRQLAGDLDHAVELRAVEVAQEIATAGPPQPGTTEPLRVPTTSMLSDRPHYVQVVSRRGTVLLSSPALPAPLPISDEARQIMLDGQVTRDVLTLENASRLALYGAPLLLDETVVGVILVAAPLWPLEQTLAQLRQVLVSAVLGSMLLAGGIGWLLASAAMRPVDRITEVARAIGRSGDLSGRVPPPHRADELGRLSIAFNELLERLDLAMAQQRRFLDDASHELRTPLTTIRANASALLRRTGPSPAALARAAGVFDRDAAGTGLLDASVQVAFGADLTQGAERDVVDTDGAGQRIVGAGESREGAGESREGAIHRAPTGGAAVGARCIAPVQHARDCPNDHMFHTPTHHARSAPDDHTPDAATRDEELELRAIAEESERMGRLVTDLLALARADAGQLPTRRPVMLDAILVDVYQQARYRASHPRLSIGDLEQVEIAGDPDRLKQLLSNLVDNACRYTPASGSVTLSLVQRDGLAHLAVQDTGPGIPPDELPRIFERFYRADRARNGEVSGTGLGLAICQVIAEGHGGRIEVESRVGVGSTFTVVLPIGAAILAGHDAHADARTLARA